MRAASLAIVAVTTVSPGCGGDDGAPRLDAAGSAAGGAGGEGVAGAPAADGGARAPGPCGLEGERYHAPIGASHEGPPPGGWGSNPPSSGSHCDEWGRYAVYGSARPLARCNYVHNLEHGAVVLLYNCPQGCAGIVSTLQALMQRAPPDPDCARKRIILTPDRDLDVPVAAAAWGYTWRSRCLDQTAQDSLVLFIKDHVGSRGIAPEARVCADGSISP
jgi:hypothetical protein